jgi:hypothetical protein
MRASLQAARIGGLVALLAVLGPDAGSAPGGAGAQPLTAVPAPTTAPPPPSQPISALPLSAADRAAAKADPDCQVTDVACAWSHCNPLGKQWQSYHACIVDSCKVQDRSCMGDLIMDLNDPARQKTGGRT